MNKKAYIKWFSLGAVFAVLTAIYIMYVCSYDVAQVGPQGSSVGFSTLNLAVHNKIGYNPDFKDISEILGYICIAIGLSFSLISVYQFFFVNKGGLFKRIFQIDRNLLAMIALYFTMPILYIVFRLVVVNYGPVILDMKEGLKASFPSSHTMLALISILGCLPQFEKYFKNELLAIFLRGLALLIGVETVILRFFSGVHWFTDIVASVFISLTLVFLYYGYLAFDKYLTELKQEALKPKEEQPAEQPAE